MDLSNLPGSPLTEKDYAMLDQSFIDRELADQASLRRVSDAEGRQLMGINGRPGVFSGIVFPYLSPKDEFVHELRLRRDVPDFEEQDGKPREKMKYVSPPRARNRLYFPPLVRQEFLDDVSLPIVIVEGEKKCLAMWRIAWWGLGDAAVVPRFLVVGLSGVWSWRGRVGITGTRSGARAEVRGVIPDLRGITWFGGRPVTLLFDSNAQTNSDVRLARQQLASWLAGQGAMVRHADLPQEQGINGPDDAAFRHGAEYVLGIVAKAAPFEPLERPVVLSEDELKMVRERPRKGFLADYEKYAGDRLAEVPSDYHTLVGLVLMAGVLGGKLSTDSKLTPNLAIIIVGQQGMGKSLPFLIARDLLEPIEREEADDFARKIQDLENEVDDDQTTKSDRTRLKRQIEHHKRTGPPSIVIATQASVEGLLETLSSAPSGIVDFDEFGAFLKDCTREHMRSARENFIKVLDGHPIIYRRARGQDVRVPRPAVSIFGTINIDSLRAAASDEDMCGGFLSRFIIGGPDLKFSLPCLKAGSTEVSDRLVSILRLWRSMSCVSVTFEADAEQRIENYGYAIAPFEKGDTVDITASEDVVVSVGFIRYRTIAQKIAILMAASEGTRIATSVVVTLRHALTAIELTEHFRQQAVRVLHHVAKNDPELVDADRLFEKIRRYPGRNRSDYQRLMHWPARRFVSAAQELESARRVSWEDERSTGGRTSRTYWTNKH
jgi:hypothetical protein